MQISSRFTIAVHILVCDVYNAVECVEDGKLFHFHENPNQSCPVGRSIHLVLDERLEEIQKAMEMKMKSISLQDIVRDTKKMIN